MKKLKTTVALVATLGALYSTSAMSQTVMRFASWMPPTHPVNEVVLPTWKKWIEDATDNRVTLAVEYNMGHPKTMFNLVEDGVADASWGYHGYVPGRFRLTQIVEQPLLGVSAEAASVAHWRVHNKYFQGAPEFDGLELVALVTHGPGQVHSTFPVNSISDLQNKKIRIGGGVQAVIGERAGLVPVAGPAPKVYEMLQQGVIDGVFLPVCDVKNLRLDEVITHTTQLPGGMYLGSFSFFINPDFLADLDPKDRDAILKVSGEQLSALGGRAQDESDVAGLEAAKAAGVNINVVAEGAPLAQEYAQLAEGIDDTWIESVADLKVDARAALDELRAVARAYQAELDK
ncbi:TRAP transporter substrate-binding protein [Marinobacterium iners]|uniref:TRAP-type C4-dicarboxylate transport system, substrate-binding protein n=1 Tax=Marinobacterium iners DSM 11526 TaxID=1122198 RepID=A0A1H4H5T9_9GAMM|nr:TRAP transporter substrate-binding protein [Marinobacterium iners]SEB17177.1 TRAP-type C4-dicarboxylate transport system, substrate-binding protein [Marinobacterium iners DSM 11526]